MQSRFRYFVGVILLAGVLALLHAVSRAPVESAAPAQAAGALPAVTGNRAPTISADAAAYARVGEPYRFQPEAADADGDRLSFTAENLPPWAQLDPATGTITGTPGDSDVGEYETITVVPRVTVAATLEWEAPMAKGDGSPLDDLAGYRIVYGRSPDDLDHSVYIGDPAQTSYEFTDLPQGVWYFAVIALNASGLEGPPTPPAMKSI